MSPDLENKTSTPYSSFTLFLLREQSKNPGQMLVIIEVANLVR
jgi:hypothetical protein